MSGTSPRPPREQVDAVPHRAAALLLAAARVDPTLRAAAGQVQDALLTLDAEMRGLRDERDDLRDEVDRLRTGERCCPDACNGGGCETCPCCSAGWCVRGRDGVPDHADDLPGWIEVAAEHNPIVAAWRADRAELDAAGVASQQIAEWRTAELAELERLRAELTRVHQVISEYVAHVESGERFDALVDLVPGLESDDGRYPTGELERLRARVAELEAGHVDVEPSTLVLAAEQACAAIERLNPDATEGTPIWDDGPDGEHFPDEIRQLFGAGAALMREIDRATGHAAPQPAAPDGAER